MIFYALLVVILASFVIAYLGAKTWHWGYVLLVEAVLLATFGFFILAAETLRINGVLRSQAKALEKSLDESTADVEALKKGTNDSVVLARLASGETPTRMPENAESIPSLEELDHQLLLATRLRGRVWRNVMPAGVDPKTGGIRVNIAAPTPAGIKADTVVYVFEQELEPVRPAAAAGEETAPPAPPPAPKQAGPRLQYLGEFTVSQAAAQQATLVPAQQWGPTDPEVKRLATTRGPWIIYETMPADRYDVFAGMNEDQVKQLLPEKSLNEYLRHGKEATADDDPHRKLGLDENGVPLPPDDIGKATKVVYQRRLRDYAVEFDEMWRRRIAMRAQIDAVTKDIEQLTAADESAKKLQAALTDQRQKLTFELDKVTKDRVAIKKHLADVEQLLVKARQLTAEVMAHNRQLAAQLAARQLRTRPAGNNGADSPTREPEPLALGRAN
jgi:hypothetical protein